MPTDGISSLCMKHRQNRGQYGSVLRSHGLPLIAYKSHLVITTRYLKRNPAPPAVLDQVAHFIEPPGRLRAGEVGYKDRLLLVREVTRWQDPAFRWTYRNVDVVRKGSRTARGVRGLPRRYDYSPTGYLATMLAVELYLAEIDWHGFPHDAPDVAVVRAIIRMHRKPGKRGSSVNTPTRATAIKLLVQRLREHSALLVFIRQTVEALMKNSTKPYRARKYVRSGLYAKQAKVTKTIKQATATAPAPPPPPKTFERVDLLRYPKPTTRVGGCSLPELRAWEVNERLLRQYPAGYYHREERS